MKIIGFAVGMILLAYFAIMQLKHLFFETSYFELQKIVVEGNKRLKTEEVVKSSGITPGLNLLNLDRETLERRLKAHPHILFAKASLYGLYTLKINITERTPFMYAKVGTTFFEISEDGVILSTDGFGENDLPIITGLNLEGRREGDSLASNDGFVEASNWIKHLGTKILAGISEINFANIQNPYIYLLSGEKVHPKNLEDFYKRYNFLCTLLDNLRKNKVEPDYLDMRAPNEIVVKPKKLKRLGEGSN